eukprot:tig00021348_g20559.t1
MRGTASSTRGTPASARAKRKKDAESPDAGELSSGSRGSARKSARRALRSLAESAEPEGPAALPVEPPKESIESHVVPPPSSEPHWLVQLEQLADREDCGSEWDGEEEEATPAAGARGAGGRARDVDVLSSDSGERSLAEFFEGLGELDEPASGISKRTRAHHSLQDIQIDEIAGLLRDGTPPASPQRPRGKRRRRGGPLGGRGGPSRRARKLGAGGSSRRTPRSSGPAAEGAAAGEGATEAEEESAGGSSGSGSGSEEEGGEEGGEEEEEEGEEDGEEDGENSREAADEQYSRFLASLHATMRDTAALHAAPSSSSAPGSGPGAPGPTGSSVATPLGPHAASFGLEAFGEMPGVPGADDGAFAAAAAAAAADIDLNDDDDDDYVPPTALEGAEEEEEEEDVDPMAVVDEPVTLEEVRDLFLEGLPPDTRMHRLRNAQAGLGSHARLPVSLPSLQATQAEPFAPAQLATLHLQLQQHVQLLLQTCGRLAWEGASECEVTGCQPDKDERECLAEARPLEAGERRALLAGRADLLREISRRKEATVQYKTALAIAPAAGSAAVASVLEVPPLAGAVAAVEELADLTGTALCASPEVERFLQRFLPRFDPDCFFRPFPSKRPLLAKRFTKAEDDLVAYGLLRFGTNYPAISQHFVPNKQPWRIMNRLKKMWHRTAPPNPCKDWDVASRRPLEDWELEILRRQLGGSFAATLVLDEDSRARLAATVVGWLPGREPAVVRALLDGRDPTSVGRRLADSGEGPYPAASRRPPAPAPPRRGRCQAGAGRPAPAPAPTVPGAVPCAPSASALAAASRFRSTRVLFQAGGAPPGASRPHLRPRPRPCLVLRSRRWPRRRRRDGCRHRRASPGAGASSGRRGAAGAAGAARPGALAVPGGSRTPLQGAPASAGVPGTPLSPSAITALASMPLLLSPGTLFATVDLAGFTPGGPSPSAPPPGARTPARRPPPRRRTPPPALVPTLEVTHASALLRPAPAHAAPTRRPRRRGLHGGAPPGARGVRAPSFPLSDSAPAPAPAAAAGPPSRSGARRRCPRRSRPSRAPRGPRRPGASARVTDRALPLSLPLIPLSPAPLRGPSAGFPSGPGAFGPRPAPAAGGPEGPRPRAAAAAASIAAALPPAPLPAAVPAAAPLPPPGTLAPGLARLGGGLIGPPAPRADSTSYEVTWEGEAPTVWRVQGGARTLVEGALREEILKEEYALRGRQAAMPRPGDVGALAAVLPTAALALPTGDEGLLFGEDSQGAPVAIIGGQHAQAPSSGALQAPSPALLLPATPAAAAALHDESSNISVGWFDTVLASEPQPGAAASPARPGPSSSSAQPSPSRPAPPRPAGPGTPGPPPPPPLPPPPLPRAAGPRRPPLPMQLGSPASSPSAPTSRRRRPRAVGPAGRAARGRPSALAPPEASAAPPSIDIYDSIRPALSAPSAPSLSSIRFDGPPATPGLPQTPDLADFMGFDPMLGSPSRPPTDGRPAEASAGPAPPAGPSPERPATAPPAASASGASPGDEISPTRPGEGILDSFLRSPGGLLGRSPGRSNLTSPFVHSLAASVSAAAAAAAAAAGSPHRSLPAALRGRPRRRARRSGRAPCPARRSSTSGAAPAAAAAPVPAAEEERGGDDSDEELLEFRRQRGRTLAADRVTPFDAPDEEDEEDEPPALAPGPPAQGASISSSAAPPTAAAAPVDVPPPAPSSASVAAL